MSPSAQVGVRSRYWTLYLLLSILGSVLPWIYLLQFFLGSVDPGIEFFQQAFANPVSTAIAADLVISSIVFWVFAVQSVAASGRWQRLLPYVFLNLGVGLSCALPLFLANSQTRQDEPG